MRVCHVRAVLFAFLLSPVAADSFLSDKLLRSNPVHNVLDHTPATAPACEHAPTGPIETTMCDYESVESVNEQLTHNLNALVRTPFFKFFQVDLYRDCPFWEENFICANKECAITTVDESDVPVKWRAAALSKIESTSMERLNQQPGCYSRESDFCFLDDNTESLYFDLSLVPERYTGYSGPSAHHVWNSIYEENCFGVSEASLLGGADSSLSPSVPDALSEMSNSNDDGLCMEKRVYYKIISGLHASISTHICHEYLNQSTLEFEPNLQCFVTRIASHPERLQYIYFNTVLLLRAVARIGPYLNAYDYCSSGTREDDKETLFHIGKVVDIAQEVGKFDETMLFRGDDAAILKEEFKAHFRNVSRIMDCVGCDKCRLWGKVQTTGLATALKILFELDEKALHPDADLLQRSEVVALINTLHRFSESLEFVNGFRSMWRKTSSADSDKLIKEARSTSSSKARPSPAAGASGEYVGERGLPYWIELCKKGAGDCVDVVLEVLKGVIKTVGKLFSPSGKDRGPMGYDL